MSRPYFSFAVEILEPRRLLSVSWGAYPKLVAQDRAVKNFPKINARGQSIAILDTGVDYRHPALGGGWGKRVIAGYDFVDQDEDPMDETGHGTAIAGIVAAGNYVYGGARYRGVAPGAKIIALRIEDNSDHLPDSRIADALQWVIEHRDQYNITAVNLSLGNGSYPTKAPQAAYGDKLATLARTGVFIAAASGNDGSTRGVNYPGADPSAFAIGSVDSNGAISSFTSRGPDLDLLAPGNKMPTTLYDVFKKSHTYVAATGTSFSTPYVAAAAMLVKQVRPHLSAAQVGSLLKSSGTPVHDNASNLDFRMLNLDRALRQAHKLNKSLPPQKRPRSLVKDHAPARSPAPLTLASQPASAFSIGRTGSTALDRSLFSTRRIEEVLEPGRD